MVTWIRKLAVEMGKSIQRGGLFEDRAKNFWWIRCEAWERAVKVDSKVLTWRFSMMEVNWDKEIRVWSIVTGKGER